MTLSRDFRVHSHHLIDLRLLAPTIAPLTLVRLLASLPHLEVLHLRVVGSFPEDRDRPFDEGDPELEALALPSLEEFHYEGTSYAFDGLLFLDKYPALRRLSLFLRGDSDDPSQEFLTSVSVIIRSCMAQSSPMLIYIHRF